MIPAYSVYLFDLDGTLVDSAQDICGTVEELIGKAEQKAWPRARMQRYIGLQLAELFKAIYPEWGAQEIESILQQYREVYLRRGFETTSLFPGVREVLSKLPGKKATATSRRSITARALLEKFDLLQYFDHVQGMDGLRSKPEPDMLLVAMQVLGAKPSECVIVGDAPADIEAGRRAGVRTCAVDYGYGDPQVLRDSRPDYFISDLRELLGGSAGD